MSAVLELAYQPIESVVVWKWHKPGYRSTFNAKSVNVMRSMVARHYPLPHRFICITDDPQGIDSGIEVYPISDEFKDIANPTWSWAPSCYRRLRSFSPEFEKIAGRRFVSIDLDCVILGDLRPLWNRTEDFVIYASNHANYHVNGSMFMMNAGCRRQVWDRFDPQSSPKAANAAGNNGSDQGWIQYVLGKAEARWTNDDGIYAYLKDCERLRGGRLPDGARLIVFHGKKNPWDDHVQKQSPWVAQHWR